MDIHQESHYHNCELKDIQEAIRLGAKIALDRDDEVLPFFQTDTEVIDNVRFDCTYYFDRNHRDEIVKLIKEEVVGNE